MLQFLGVDEQSEGVYRLLLAQPGLGIEELAGRLRMTGTEARRCLDQLAELALIRPSWDSPGVVRAVSPRVGMELLLQRRQAELLTQQQMFAESQREVAQLVQEHQELTPGREHPGVERLMGMDAIQARIAELAAAASEEVACLVPGGAQDPRYIDAAKVLDLRVRERGVAIRTVALDSIRKDPTTLAYARWQAGIGAEVRTAPVLTIRMLIYDRRVALVPVDPQNSSLGAAQVVDVGTVTALTALFDQVWCSARPITETSVPVDESGLTPQERELLALLSRGLTDEMAGRRLGLSARSVRRIMAGLMARLGARSRFEAGLKACESGWLTSPRRAADLASD